jgi:hypothetical protein
VIAIIANTAIFVKLSLFLFAKIDLRCLPLNPPLILEQGNSDSVKARKVFHSPARQ